MMLSGFTVEFFIIFKITVKMYLLSAKEKQSNKILDPTPPPSSCNWTKYNAASVNDFEELFAANMVTNMTMKIVLDTLIGNNTN